MCAKNRKFSLFRKSTGFSGIIDRSFYLFYTTKNTPIGAKNVKNDHFTVNIYAKTQRKTAFMQPFLHKCLTLVRSTGIENVDLFKKSFIFKAFVN